MSELASSECGECGGLVGPRFETHLGRLFCGYYCSEAWKMKQASVHKDKTEACSYCGMVCTLLPSDGEKFCSTDCRELSASHQEAFDSCGEATANKECYHCDIRIDPGEECSIYQGFTFCSDDCIGYWKLHDRPQPSPLSRQEGGDHYKDMPIQPFEYIHRNGLGFGEGTVIKYVSRWRAKNGVEDLRKAKHVLEMMIAEEES